MMTPAETVFAVIQGAIALMLSAALPWAFVIERRLARIEASVGTSIHDHLEAIDKRAERTSDSVREHDSKIAEIAAVQKEHTKKFERVFVRQDRRGGEG